MSVKERLKFYIKERNYTQKEFSASIGLSSGYINAIRNSISPEVLSKIKERYPELNTEWLLRGTGEMIQMEGKPLMVGEPEGTYNRELKEKIYEGLTPVRLVSIKARGGWTDNYYSEEYVRDMPTVLIESDKDYQGNYMAFEVDGDSMEPEYYPGDIVICREVKRELWKYKLHYDQYDFVIAHGTKGIMIKEIIDHDVENGIITCHSLNNPDGKNNDFQIKLGEVALLFNVVEVRQKGKDKKRRR